MSSVPRGAGCRHNVQSGRASDITSLRGDHLPQGASSSCLCTLTPQGPQDGFQSQEGRYLGSQWLQRRPSLLDPSIPSAPLGKMLRLSDPGLMCLPVRVAPSRSLT